jgi:hypothetical protein
MLSHHSSPSPDQKLQIKLQTALKYARVTCALGACNKYDDYIKTNGWANIQPYLTYNNGDYVKHGDLNKPNGRSALKKDFDGKRDIDLNPEVNFNNNKGKKPDHANHHWFFRINYYSWINRFEHYTQIVQAQENPSEASSNYNYLDPVDHPRFKVSEKIKGVISRATLSRITRQGTCTNYAALIFMYLWQHSEGIHRIEIMRKPGFDHVFVVVNREGSPDDPCTWGDAWIIDGWYKDGIIYHAREYLTKIAEIETVCSNDLDNFLLHIGVEKIENPTIHEKNALIAGVKPGEDIYPTYDRHKSVFDYYEFTDGRFLPIKTFDKIRDLEATHQNMMQPALTDVRLFKSHRSLIRPSTIPDEKKGYFCKK